MSESDEMLKKLKEYIKRKGFGAEEGRQIYRKLHNKLGRSIETSMNRKCIEIKELQTTGNHGFVKKGSKYVFKVFR